MKGSAFGASILKLTGEAREKAILNAALVSENLPKWLRGPWIEVKASDRLSYFVAPDYFAIGEDGDFLRMPMRPETAQSIATHYGAMLPTRRMVDQIYKRADQKLEAVTFVADMTTATMIEHNKAVGDRSPGEKNLLAGHKKDVVVGPDLDGSRVAIYGWQPDRTVFPHQPYSTIHSHEYVDYSHGVRLINRVARFDGKAIDLFEAFKDPALLPLVSDQGSFVPVFPNKGVTFSTTPEGPSTGSYAPIIVGVALGGIIGGPLGAVFGGVAGALSTK